MQTILDVSSTQKEWLVKLRLACRGVSAIPDLNAGQSPHPWCCWAYTDGLREVDRGLPVIFDKGTRSAALSLICHKTLQCREIRGRTAFRGTVSARSCARRSSFVTLWTATGGTPFRQSKGQAMPECTRTWLRMTSIAPRPGLHPSWLRPYRDTELFDATRLHGRTLFMGKTCSAFTAGVMAIGLRAGEIENSRLRVIRLLAIMTAGGDAFDESINKFNRSMNRGYQLSKWFRRMSSAAPSARRSQDATSLRSEGRVQVHRGRSDHQVQGDRARLPSRLRCVLSSCPVSLMSRG